MAGGPLTLHSKRFDAERRNVAAAGRRPGTGGLSTFRTVGAAASADRYGTALPAGATAVAVIVSQTFPIVAPSALGQLVLAAVAVAARVVTGKNVSIS
ncbi:hypothetical protein SAMN05216276_10012 [Streptosporangium subroseum]|uniref:Uncharacterized protein n=1 Tax=Streptosporangium subroseum TaxID=106412 RepID=A0A238ZY62_9ACTN|nr:hypothetical protein [Streptosporangium subroseum]SNR88327.1 hypothetical protein SAMN05216276_10012 [Streptosporangium subroseum]